jgi:hypothetical protein
LLLQLTCLERKTRSGGKDVIDHPNGMKDDLANAVAGVCVLVSREKYWTVEQMNSNLPSVIGHQHSKQFFVRPSRAREEMEKELMEDMNASRIVRKTVS